MDGAEAQRTASRAQSTTEDERAATEREAHAPDAAASNGAPPAGNAPASRARLIDLAADVRGIGSVAPAYLLRLQRLSGNQSVMRAIQARGVLQRTPAPPDASSRT